MKRGITPVITTLLLSAIMITSLIIMFYFSVPFIYKNARPPSMKQTRLTIEYCNGTSISIRNTGSNELDATKFYVGPPAFSDARVNITLTRGEQSTFDIYNSSNPSQSINIRAYKDYSGGWYYLTRNDTSSFVFTC